MSMLKPPVPSAIMEAPRLKLLVALKLAAVNTRSLTLTMPSWLTSPWVMSMVDMPLERPTWFQWAAMRTRSLTIHDAVEVDVALEGGGDQEAVGVDICGAAGPGGAGVGWGRLGRGGWRCRRRRG